MNKQFEVYVTTDHPYINNLIPLTKSPFKVVDDKAMKDLVESINKFGILEPLTVRRSDRKGTKYEVISGYRRLEACKRLGIQSVPVRILDISRDNAIIAMIDSNLCHREHILPSEKAAAYKMKLDAIHYKVKQDHQYITKAAYVVLGINLDGQKDILGIWIGEHENSKFWLNVLNDVKTRGVKDIFLFCVDGLNGFREAIQAVYPNSQIQRCIIHQIRSSTRFVRYKHIKPLMSDLKKVYQAVSEDEAMNNLIAFKDKWGKIYPSCVKSWEENWDILSTFFAYPPDVRKIIYTTNIIEGLNRQFRQITKNKPSFTNDDSLRKMLYLASQKIVERWTQRCRNWDMVLNQLSIIFEDRLSA